MGLRKSYFLFSALSLLCGVLSGLLLLRLIVRLMLANPANPAVRGILGWSRPLLFPWSGLWPPSDLPIVELERAALLSLATYFLAGVFFGLAARQLRRRTKEE
ncbi:MAG: hypothetical protein ACP5SI_06405 [Chloroflexia bacterium]